MALASLATVADLSVRGVDTSDVAAITELLAAASSAVREAAGVAITRATTTVTLWTTPTRRIDLPGPPVVSVDSVVLDGTTLTVDTDYVLRGHALWRVNCTTWQYIGDPPSELVVTYTHGLAEVPADIVDLVCSLVAAGVSRAADGYDPHVGETYESIDDSRTGFAIGADAVASVMELPDRTRRWLARRFGGSSVVVGSFR